MSDGWVFDDVFSRGVLGGVCAGMLLDEEWTCWWGRLVGWVLGVGGGGDYFVDVGVFSGFQVFREWDVFVVG